MKVTVAHMGRFADLMHPFLEALGLTTAIAPRPNKRTLARGILLSPEAACLPLKLNIGTFLDAAEIGADTILMAGGLGPCRFGYYAEVQRNALARAGYDMRMVVLEPPRGRLRDLARTVGQLVPGVSLPRLWGLLRLAVSRIDAADFLEARALHVAAREVEQGRADAILRAALQSIAGAASRSALLSALEQGTEALSAVPVDEGLVRARVAVVGEIYSLLEPFVNMDVAHRLARLRVEVTQTVTLSDWVRQNLTLNPITRRANRRRLLSDARGYLGHWVGGEGLESIANAAGCGRAGIDGVLHVAPFTCMPEIVAQSILPRVAQDLDLPCMSLFFDEHSSETGLDTRLEAFVDLLEMRSRRPTIRNIRSPS